MIDRLKTSAEQSPPTLPSPIDRARDLAYSQPEFDSVGRLDVIEENPANKGIVTASKLAFKSPGISSCASGVYIGNHIVITAAHVIPDFVKNGVFISHPAHLWYFSLRDKNGRQFYTRVISAVRHPDFQGSNDKLINHENIKNDIAVLLIDGEPGHARAVEMGYEHVTIKYNCTVVGFPGIFLPREPHDRRKFSMDPCPADRSKLAVKLPNSYLCLDTLEHKIGYDAEIQGGKLIHHKRTYNADENGVAKGMSGGGLYSEDQKLIGIMSAITQPDIFQISNLPSYSLITGDCIWATPLCHHQAWLTKTIRTFQDKLPQYSELSRAWYKQRAVYELMETSPEQTHPKRAYLAALVLAGPQVVAGFQIAYNMYRFFRKSSDKQLLHSNKEGLDSKESPTLQISASQLWGHA